MTTAETILAAAATSAALFTDIPRGIYLLAGQDATRYLHGRVTQDIKALKANEGAEALLLTPQGRTLGQLLLANLGNRFLAVSDPLDRAEDRSDLLRSLLLFKVADDVQSEDLSERYGSIEIIGLAAQSIVEGALQITIPAATAPRIAAIEFGENSYLLNRAFGPFSAIQLIAPLTALPQIQASFASLPRGEFDGYEAIRITAGIPRMGKEIHEKLVGADLPLERTVAFRKGCYAGQEVIEMATARGRPNRRLISLALKAPVAEGTEVFQDDDGSQKAVGTVTSALFLPELGETRALAFVKYAVAEDAKLFAGATEVSSHAPGR